MAIIEKTVTEKIGTREKTLITDRTHSGGEDITIIVLSSIWDTIASVSTTWEDSKTLEKDE